MDKSIFIPVNKRLKNLLTILQSAIKKNETLFRINIILVDPAGIEPATPQSGADSPDIIGML